MITSRPPKTTTARRSAPRPPPDRLRSLSLSLACLVAFTASALAQTQPATPAMPDTVIADPANDPAWHGLFAQLGLQKSRVSRFEELRHFPFRQNPIVLEGEIRISPERGLSLNYFGSKPHIVIVDRDGVLLRDDQGRQRSAPPDDRAQAATSALFEILRFDLAALTRDFVVHGRRDGEHWTIGFVARDPNLGTLMGTVIVQGESTRLQRIDMIKSEKQRIEILIKTTLEDVIFPPDVVKKFFR